MISKNISEFIANARDHVAQDKVIKGLYTRPNGQACFIGCHAGEDNPERLLKIYGLPTMVIRIAEIIFEGLPDKEAQQQFHIDLPEAIGVDGKDLSMVGWKFLRNMLTRLPSTTSNDVVIPVIDLLNHLIGGKSHESLKEEFLASAIMAEARVNAEVDAGATCTHKAWKAARAAAWVAAEAWTDTTSKAWAWAWIWADTDKYPAEREHQRRDLLELLKEAPITSMGLR